MKPSNTELIQQLGEITKNLRFSSESDASFEPFLWETNERGVLKLESFLLTVEFIRDSD